MFIYVHSYTTLYPCLYLYVYNLSLYISTMVCLYLYLYLHIYLYIYVYLCLYLQRERGRERGQASRGNGESTIFPPKKWVYSCKWAITVLTYSSQERLALNVYWMNYNCCKRYEGKIPDENKTLIPAGAIGGHTRNRISHRSSCSVGGPYMWTPAFVNRSLKEKHFIPESTVI